MTTVVDRQVTVWQGKTTPNIKVAGCGAPVVFLHGAAGLVWDEFLEWGKEDRLVSPVYAQEFASRILGVRIALIGQAGHMPAMEYPAHVATLVREFLRDERTLRTVS